MGLQIYAKLRDICQYQHKGLTEIGRYTGSEEVGFGENRDRGGKGGIAFMFAPSFAFE